VSSGANWFTGKISPMFTSIVVEVREDGKAADEDKADQEEEEDK